MAIRFLLSLTKRAVTISPCVLLIPVLFLSGLGFADSVVQPCEFDSLEATFQATDGPGNSYTVAMNPFPGGAKEINAWLRELRDEENS
jgi:hypothetical protein